MIKQRLEVYVPFLEPLRRLQAEVHVLDLGCGRGEWLELMRERGFAARGIDLDDGMLASCSELGLDAGQEDVLEALRQAADASLSVVSAFHVVEHLPFETVRQVLGEAFRVLIPGGLLILETPNPENLVVGTSNFYLDPTHERPIPPLLLSFATEQAGFLRNKVLRLQEEAGLLARALSLSDVIGGASPDYGVVAQKPGPGDVLVLFESVFAPEFGVSLDAVAQAYESQLRERGVRHEERLQSANVDLQQMREAVDHVRETLEFVGSVVEAARQAEARALLAEARANRAEERAKRVEHMATHAIAHANDVDARVAQVAVLVERELNANPLRSIAASIRKVRVSMVRGIKRETRRMLATTARAIVRYPRLKSGVVDCLNLAPSFRKRLSVVLAPPASAMGTPASAADISEAKLEPIETIGLHSALSPHAQSIYRELHLALNVRSH